MFGEFAAKCMDSTSILNPKTNLHNAIKTPPDAYNLSNIPKKKNFRTAISSYMKNARY